MAKVIEDCTYYLDHATTVEFAGAFTTWANAFGIIGWMLSFTAIGSYVIAPPLGIIIGLWAIAVGNPFDFGNVARMNQTAQKINDIAKSIGGTGKIWVYVPGSLGVSYMTIGVWQ
jgi:hypothetical protein